LGGSNIVQSQRFITVFVNARAIEVHVAQLVLCPIKALRCSQTKTGNCIRWAQMLTERELTVSAAQQ
jgi:hypothetical protein